MHKYFLAILISMLSVKCCCAMTAWEIFVSSPTPANAQNVFSITYSNPERNKELDRDLELLEVQVLAGDREAVDLAFRLREKADGYVAETLDITLGRLIRINPGLFLNELNNNRARIGRLSALVGNTGQAFADNIEARSYEIDMRISALKEVKEKRLEETKNECLSELYIGRESLRVILRQP